LLPPLLNTANMHLQHLQHQQQPTAFVEVRVTAAGIVTPLYLLLCHLLDVV
jgi:hypothetical protein